jgi:transposase InsO family protein
LRTYFLNFSGAKYFSILDARSGYWNIPLDKNSSLLTTFNTPFGRYRYTRLPFGLNIAQDVFQKKIDETFGDIPGCTGIADDLVICGWKADGSDHDASLRAVIERARQTGVRFNDEKMVIRCKQIPFFGHLIGEDGVRPDPHKVEAINNMEEPSDVKGLQTFLGMANYLSRFTPRLSHLTSPLRELCKKDRHFQWGPEHTKAFAAVKTEISSASNLPFYEATKPLTLQVDASLRGLGAALIQDQGPIAYASKSLTDTESRYSNIEREMLGIVFGLERFHHYVYGRQVLVETDHKPLEAIVRKNLANAPPRLSRMLLRLQRYDTEVKYVPGKEIPLADALSRITPSAAGDIKGLDISVHEMRAILQATPACLESIKQETSRNPEMSALREVICNGWPSLRIDCPQRLIGYWNYRDEMGVEDGLILKGTRIVIPPSMRKSALEKLHYAHQGIEKCKLRARRSMFWHGINKDIEEMVQKCATCQKHQNSQSKEPMHPHDVPPRPWHTLASDLFHWQQHTFLLVVDMFSKFPIIRKLTSLSSSAVVNHLRSIFEEHGIPERFMSDNGPQYSADEFRKFATTYGFVHVTSSPHYPQSNGFIERQVQTVKQVLTKCHETGSDPYLAMLCLRTTPLDHNTPSPCELLNNRLYRCTIPSKALRCSDDNDALQQRQDNARVRYDHNVRPLPPLRPEEDVRVQNPVTKTWTPGRVVAACEQPRSYTVQTDKGTYRRNRRHIRKTREQFGSIKQPVQQIPEQLERIPTGPSRDTAISPPASPEPPEAPEEPMLRRSSRVTKPPDRLSY